LETNKRSYLRSDHSEKIHIQKSRKKKQVWCGNGICFVIYRMRCIGGISILFIIYEMWWNLNPACNIFCQRYYIYAVYILLLFSNGKEMRINEPRCHCYRQETRTNEPVSPLLWARYAKSRTGYISKSLPNFTWQILCFADF
jgi:hypothetical protein